MIVRQPLYNKYRPSKFSEVVGQELLVKLVKNAVKLGKHPNGWLIHGSFGSGKTTIARLYAKAVFCSNLGNDQEPCNNCYSCKSIDNGTYGNYIEEDSASNSKIENVERVLLDCYDLPVDGKKYKIIVLDECHIISSTGKSKFLKTLEDGLPHVIFIFLTTHVDKILDTLQSRLQKVAVTTVSSKAISDNLESICVREGFKYEKSALDLIAKKSKGHIRDSLTFLDQISSLGDVLESSVRDHFLQINIIKVCELVENISKDTPKSLSILEELCSILTPNGIKMLLLEVLNESSKFKFCNEQGVLTEEIEYFRRLFLQYGDSLFNMFSFVNNEPCSDYFAIENLIMILGLYTRDSVVYSSKSHVETKRDGYSTKVRQKSYRKTTTPILKETVITPNEFASILKGEIVS